MQLSSMIEMEDIFTCILTEWISFNDRLKLDLVVNGAKRAILHEVYRRMPMAMLSHAAMPLINWMSTRQVYRTTGLWRLEHDALQECLDNASRRPILEHMEQLEVQCEHTPFDWNQFAIFRSLKVLHLCYPQFGDQCPPTMPIVDAIFRRLEKVSISYCRLFVDILKAFAHCQCLSEVEYNMVKLSVLRADEHAVVWPYFHRMKAFRFTGNVNEVLTTRFPQRELDLQSLQLVATVTDDHSVPLGCFLKCCSQLIDLTLSDCTISFESTVHILCIDLKQLKRLNLVYCTLSDVPTTLPTGERRASCNVETLLISGTTFNKAVFMLLLFLGARVENLTLSIWGGLDWHDVVTIHYQVPHLRTLTVDHHASSSSAKWTVVDYEREFGHLGRLTVNCWTNWTRLMFVGSQEDYLFGKTVLLDISI